MANRIQQAYNASKITKEVGDEIDKLKSEAKDRSWWQSLGSTLGGGLALTLLSGGTLNPVTLGALTSLGSAAGGAIGANQRKISKDYSWAGGAADDLREELNQKLLTDPLKKGVYAGIGQAKHLKSIDSDWDLGFESLTDFSDIRMKQIPGLTDLIESYKSPNLASRDNYGTTATMTDAATSRMGSRMVNQQQSPPNLLDAFYEKYLDMETEGMMDYLPDDEGSA
jgi:hypothetical protein